MVYPLISKQVLAELRLAHGAFNVCVMLAFLYQGSLGLKIRRARKAGAPLPFPAIKRHRRLGPVLAVLGGLGFCAGLTLVLLDTGKVLEYPSHFIGGLAVLLLIIAVSMLSRTIKGQDSPSRTPHAVLGIMLLSVYFLEAFLGIGVLF